MNFATPSPPSSTPCISFACTATGIVCTASRTRSSSKPATIIERQVGQLARLVDDLLEVSRITTGRIQLHQERIAVGGVVEQCGGDGPPADRPTQA